MKRLLKVFGRKLVSRRFIALLALCWSAQSQAQMVAPLTIIHGSDYGVYGNNNFLGPQHMAYADGVLAISGILSAEDSYMLDYKIKTYGWQIHTVVLNSEGGSSYAGFLLAAMVRQHRWATDARLCESACVVIWAAGNHRAVEGRLGVHQSSDALQFDSPADLKATAHMASVLASYGAPRSVISRLMATPPSRMYWVTDDELRLWKRP